MNQYIDHIEKYRLNQLTNLLDQFEDLLYEAVDDKLKYYEDYPNIVLQVAGKASLMLRAIINLCIAGLPEAAFALARNIYEQSIILSFFETVKSNPDFNTYVEDYYIDYRYQVARDAKWRAEMISNDQAATQQYEAQLESLQNMTIRRIQGDYWWTGQRTLYGVVKFIIDSYPQKAVRSKYLIAYSLYRRACKDVHAGSLGNTLRLGSTREIGDVDNSAKTSGHGLPLYFAVSTFHMIAYFVFNNMAITNTQLLIDMDGLLDLYAKIDSTDTAD